MVIFYIFSISFQLAGALLIMTFSISTKKDDIIKDFAKSNFIIQDNIEKKLIYNEIAFLEKYELAYLTKYSFGYLVFGYLLGIFGSVGEENKILVLIGIILLTGIIIIISLYCTRKKIKNLTTDNKKITMDDLKRLGLEATIENYSFDEIDEILKI